MFRVGLCAAQEIVAGMQKETSRGWQDYERFSTAGASKQR